MEVMLVLPRAGHAPHRTRPLWRRFLFPVATYRSARPGATRGRRWRYAILAVMFFTLVPGDRGLYRLVGVLRDRAALRADISALEAKRAALERDLRRVTSDPAVIERLAREQLDMIRRGETVYKFPAAK